MVTCELHTVALQAYNQDTYCILYVNQNDAIVLLEEVASCVFK